MSVFTALSSEAAAAWLEGYALGTLESLEGIAEGVQNSNFFLGTTRGAYVLTLFEQVARDEIPFFLALMAYLAGKGIPCPAPFANRRNAQLTDLDGKPAAILSRLPGRSQSAPSLAQCAAIGELLADLHRAARAYPGAPAHRRDTAWCATVAAAIEPLLAADDALLLRDELRHQRTCRPGDLPRGVIHADLFRDNVLFLGERVSGVLDFYFAGVDDLLFDLAVTVNDWCSMADAGIDEARCLALLAAYEARRPLEERERAAWPTMLRAAALRFWVSRLHDHHLPRPGALVVPRDPARYRSILLARRARGA